MVACQLLPTPQAQNGEPRNQRPYLRPLTDPQNLENAVGRMLPAPRVSSANGPSQREIDEGDPNSRLETAIAVLALTLAPSDDKKTGTDPHPSPPPTGDSTPPSSSG